MDVEITILKTVLRRSDKAQIFVPDRSETVSEERFEEIMSHPANFNRIGGRFKFSVSQRPDGENAMVVQTGIYKTQGPHATILCVRTG